MPVITISRMYGSAGSEVAERVARTLGWALFDDTMIDAIAERSGLTRAEVTAQDERVPSLVERLPSALRPGPPENMPRAADRPCSLRRTRCAMLTRRAIGRSARVLLRAARGATQIRDGEVQSGPCRSR